MKNKSASSTVQLQREEESAPEAKTVEKPTPKVAASKRAVKVANK